MDLFVPVKADQYDSTDWQEEDLAQLVDKEGSANWSEMGCYKTTTGLWLAKRRVASLGTTDFTPAVLIVTSRAGKGTYYDAMPKTLASEGWRFFDVTVNGAVSYTHLTLPTILRV